MRGDITMRLTRPMLWGGVLGAIVGIAGTVISLFQYDSQATTAIETAAVGLLVGVPVTTIAGVLLGLLWGAVFGAGQGGGGRTRG